VGDLRRLANSMSPELHDDKPIAQLLFGVQAQNALQFGVNSSDISRRNAKVDDPGAAPLNKDEGCRSRDRA
jgi:hypothetical protein